MRLVKMALLTGLLTLSYMTHANAQTWYFVSVNFAGGTDTGRVYVNVTDKAASPEFTGSWCFNDSITHTKVVLAGALTAVSVKSQTVFALLSNPAAAICTVHSVLAGEGP